MSVTARTKDKDSNIWWIFVNHNGRRTSKKIGSRVEAERLADVLRGRLAAGDLSMDDLNKEETRPYRHYLQLWFTMGCPVRKAGGLKESTIEDYKSLLKIHVSKATFYDKPIDTITESDIELFLLSKSNKASSTVQHIKNLLSHGFKRAQKDRAISINPCAGADVNKKSTFKANPYNREEIELLLSEFKKNRYHTLTLFLCRTGCRCGEAAALHWEDVSLSNRTATIKRSFTRGRTTDTKSGRDRKVDLSMELVAALRKLKLKNQSNSEFVFQNGSGNLIDMNNFRKREFDIKCKAAGLHKTRLHDLRHSYASMVISMTKDILYASKQLGHSTIQTTCDRYGHILDDNPKIRLVDVLDQNIDEHPLAPHTHPEQKKELTENG